MLERYFVRSRPAKPDCVLPDVGFGFFLFQLLADFLVHAIRQFVMRQHLKAAARRFRLDGVECLGRPLAQDKHELVAIRVGVFSHEGRVLFLVNHHIVHLKANLLEKQPLPETGQCPAAIDFVADYPYHHAAMRPSMKFRQSATWIFPSMLSLLLGAIDRILASTLT